MLWLCKMLTKRFMTMTIKTCMSSMKTNRVRKANIQLELKISQKYRLKWLMAFNWRKTTFARTRKSSGILFSQSWTWWPDSVWATLSPISHLNPTWKSEASRTRNLWMCLMKTLKITSVKARKRNQSSAFQAVTQMMPLLKLTLEASNGTGKWLNRALSVRGIRLMTDLKRKLSWKIPILSSLKTW